MEMITDIVLRVVYSATIEILRRKIVSSISEGDVDLGQLREQLMKEFEILKESITVIRIAPLLSAEHDLSLAFSALKHNNHEDALFHFSEVKRHANDGFSMAVDVNGMIPATKLQILATMYINRFYDSNANFSYIGEQCSIHFQRLCNSTTVKTALADPSWPGILFGSGKGPNSQRSQIMTELSSIRCFVYRFTGRVLDVIDAQGNSLCLASGIKSSHVCDGYSWLKVCSGVILTGKDDCVYLHSADMSNNKILQIGSKVLSAIAIGNVLYVATESALESWSITESSRIGKLVVWPYNVTLIDLWSQATTLIYRVNRRIFGVIREGNFHFMKHLTISRDMRFCDSAYHNDCIYFYELKRSLDITRMCLLPGLESEDKFPCGLSALCKDAVYDVNVAARLFRSHCTIVLSPGLSAVEKLELARDTLVIRSTIGSQSMDIMNDKLFYLAFDTAASNCKIMSVNLTDYSFRGESEEISYRHPQVPSLLAKNGFLTAYCDRYIHIFDSVFLIKIAMIAIPNVGILGHCVTCDMTDASLLCLINGRLITWDIVEELNLYRMASRKSTSAPSDFIPVALRSFLEKVFPPCSNKSVCSTAVAAAFKNADQINIGSVLKSTI